VTSRRFHALRVPTPTPTLLFTRLAFAQEHKHDDIKKWFFVDETGLEVGSNHQIYWVQPGVERPVVEKSSHPVRVSFFAGISWDRWTAPAFIVGNVNGDKYIELLRDHALPQLQDGQLILLQDRASFHMKKEVKEWMKDNNISWLEDFPPYSPDLNAIEYVWSWVKKKVEEKAPQTTDEIKAAIIGAWRDLSAETMRGYIAHIPNVLRQVIAAKGGNTK
jgi:transposase